MPEISTRADLERLIEEQLQESFSLDYKRSDALSKSDNRKKDELAKDVSAFANSAGGQLIYGIEEDGHVPTRIDDGVDVSEITKEWIEQVLNTTVQPKIDGLRIQQIPLSEGRAAYIITIPQATSRAPHQARDKRYYRRYNFESVPMEDYEVRDALRRSETPEIYTDFNIPESAKSLTIRPFNDNCDPVTIDIYLGNRSPAPAMYTLFTLSIGHFPGYPRIDWNTFDFKTMEEQQAVGPPLLVCRKRLSIPDRFPIFKESQEHIGNITANIPSIILHRPGWKVVPFEYHIQTPGFSTQVNGEFRISPERRIDFDWHTEKRA